jgi:hypothetical protein
MECGPPGDVAPRANRLRFFRLQPEVDLETGYS